jgi:hypothetical protein
MKDQLSVDRQPEPCQTSDRRAPSRICDQFWSDFITVANILYDRNEEADIYEVFEFIRIYLHGEKPYSQGLLNRVDGEIRRDIEREKNG